MTTSVFSTDPKSIPKFYKGENVFNTDSTCLVDLTYLEIYLEPSSPLGLPGAE